MALASALVQVIISAVRKTARPMLRDFGEVAQLQVSRKGPGDFVTAADLKAEDTLYELLMKARPGYGFLGEERGLVEGTDKSHTWIVDPIDGTTNFMHGFPQYCISIALSQRGVITQSVVYDPARNDLFTATKGAGAYLNEKRIRVGKLDRIANALLATGYQTGSPAALKEYLEMYGIMAERSQGIRRAGSAALDLAYVACGRLDGFYEKGLKPWDIAGGALLVTEAGGLVGNFTGEANFLEQRECLAANPKIYGQLVGLTGKYSKFANAGEKAAMRAADIKDTEARQTSTDSPI